MNPLLENLDPSQAAAVDHPDGPLLVVAGPGSGKTRVLTRRVATLLDRGVPASRVLAVTFTNKAAGEMRERLEPLVGAEQLSKLWVSTFHAACTRILRIEHEAAGLPRNFAILDVADASKLLRRAAVDLHACSSDELKDYVRTARSNISWAKNRGVPLSEIATVSELDRITEVAGRYASEMNKAGSVDFDDLLLLVNRLFTAGSDTAHKWAERFDHVLVDEFQDTNPIQMDLVRHLVSVSRNITAVGDLDQSVYAFRAADPEGMAGFTSEWPDASVVILDRNYRSTPQIVATSAAIISSNPAIHRAAQTAHHDAGEAVTVRACADDRDEARYIADMIRSIGGPLRDHAVLVRTNSQTRSLEDAFSRARIAYDLVGTVKFYDRAEVKDALAWMRTAVNQHDTVAFERATTAPRSGIGPATLDTIRAAAGQDEVSLHRAAVAVASAGGRGATAVERFMLNVAAVRDRLAQDGVAAGVKTVLDLGVRQHWSTGDGAQERLENLDQLLSAAAEFEAEGVDVDGRAVASLPAPERVIAFLNHVALVSSSDSEAPDRVLIMTVHAAKGREFPNVYVAGVEEDLIPHIRSESVADIREERRLLFVATSRAERRLFITHAQQRYMFGKPKECTPSRFLADLPADVRRVDGTGRTPTEPRHTRLERPRPQRRFAPATARPTGAPHATVDPSTVSVGTRVDHNAFGEGVITSISGDIATVRFSQQTKTLDLTFAPMKVIPPAP